MNHFSRVLTIVKPEQANVGLAVVVALMINRPKSGIRNRRIVELYVDRESFAVQTPGMFLCRVNHFFGKLQNYKITGGWPN